ncbi:MAG TPA: type II secretion system minor pseudopilin GspH [Steroidobacteraceae bacterium]|nr:type II secretion system minor pseudopilin GspH [Steroidobacteraceae bacterium]
MPYRWPAYRPQRGFTLLEVLVVMLIIALLTSAAIISLGSTGKDSELEKERDRLAALMSYVRERGAMLTIEYGIRCAPHGYRFVYFDNRTNQWQPEIVDDTLRLRHLPAGLNLSLVIEGHQIVLDDKNLTIPKALTTPAGGKLNTLGSDMPSTFETQNADNAPQVLLLSNGDVNSFSLKLERQGTRRSATLQSKADESIATGPILEPK